MVKLTKVVSDDLYDHINSYVESNKIIVEDYEGMVKTILRMTKDGYCFTMDRDILRDAMESLTYMYSPEDDMNKDRLIQQLVDDDSDDEDSEEGGEDGEGLGNMDLMKMMQMMGGMGGMGGMPDMSGMPECPPCTQPTDEEVVVKKEGSANDNADACEDKQCPVTGECCKEACSDSKCVKEESSKDEELVPSENVD